MLAQLPLLKRNHDQVWVHGAQHSSAHSALVRAEFRMDP